MRKVQFLVMFHLTDQPMKDILEPSLFVIINSFADSKISKNTPNGFENVFYNVYTG